MWFQQLFGDTSRFALKLTFAPDPSPASGMDERLRASWGELQIHASGRCLTRHEVDGGLREGILWYQLPFLRWLDVNGVAALNEEPFPAPVGTEEVDDAVTWLEASLGGPIVSVTEEEEDAWFERRSDWTDRHSLRRAFSGAVCPYLLIRRVGEHLELSWDNERYPPGRPGVRFLESRGAVLVPAADAADALRAAFRAAVGALSRDGSLAFSGALANGHGPGRDGWHFLVHPATRELLDDPILKAIRRRMEAAVPDTGAYIPQTVLTALLRGAPIATREQLTPLLALENPPEVADPRLPHLDVAPAIGRTPWMQGYEIAKKVRGDLGWGNEGAPAIGEFLRAAHVAVSESPLLPGIACAVAGRGDGRIGTVISSSSGMGERMKYSTALGHVVMDLPKGRDFGVISGRWSHWPTVARAKAFGAMLLMPEDAVRAMVQARGRIDATLIREMLLRFGTEAPAATWHLYNLRLISDEARVSLLTDLCARGPHS